MLYMFLWLGVSRRRAVQASFAAEEDYFNLDAGTRAQSSFPAFTYKHLKNRHGVKRVVRTVRDRHEGRKRKVRHDKKADLSTSSDSVCGAKDCVLPCVCWMKSDLRRSDFARQKIAKWLEVWNGTAFVRPLPSVLHDKLQCTTLYLLEVFLPTSPPCTPHAVDCSSPHRVGVPGSCLQRTYLSCAASGGRGVRAFPGGVLRSEGAVFLPVRYATRANVPVLESDGIIACCDRNKQM